MPMYYLIEYSDNYSKRSGSLWQYYRDETALDSAGVIILLLFLVTVFRLNKRLKYQEKPLLMVFKF